MGDIHSIELSSDDVDERLENGGTGVLSLARDDEPYAVPVSYGYDGDSFYFRLGSTPESEKGEFLRGRPTVKFVVYGEGAEGWWSVVATGTLAEVTEAAIDSRVTEAIRAMKIPFVTIYDRPAREVDFQLFRLEAESVTGRRER